MAIKTLPDGTEYDDSIPVFDVTGRRFNPFDQIAEEQLAELEAETSPDVPLFDEDGNPIVGNDDDDVFSDLTGND